MLEIIKDITNAEYTESRQTLEEAGIVSVDYISSDSKYKNNSDLLPVNDPSRKRFDLPTTIRIQFKPMTRTSDNAHVVGLAILAKLTLLMPRNACKLVVTVKDGAHLNKAAIDK